MTQSKPRQPLAVVFARSNELSSSARSAVYFASTDPAGWRLAIFHLGTRLLSQPLWVLNNPTIHLDIFVDGYGVKGAYQTLTKAFGDLESSFILMGSDSDSQDAAAELSSRSGGPVFTGVHHFDGSLIEVSNLDKTRLEVHSINLPSIALVETVPLSMGKPYEAIGEEFAYELASEGVIPLASTGSKAPNDLPDASFVLCGGGGIGDLASWNQLEELSQALGATLGATRVVTDRGWASGDLQIGASGQRIAPKVYLTFGVSGANQHLSNVELPDKVISVNTDPGCQMVAVSSLSVISDAALVAKELLHLVKEDGNANEL